MAESRDTSTQTAVGPQDLLESMAVPVFLISDTGHILYVNPAGEHLFGTGARSLLRRPIRNFLSGDSPVLAMLDRVVRRGRSAVEYGIRLTGPSMAPRIVDARASPCHDTHHQIVLTLHARSVAQSIGGHRLGQMSAARSATGFAETLTHEIRNPLSGIRGAAQLLEEAVGPSDRELTRLIRDETDRIGKLLARFDTFVDGATVPTAPVNVHVVLDRVFMLAKNGFAKSASFTREYDPSIPMVPGDRDRLVQSFLNLAKNAAEANPEGTIRLITGIRHGLRVQTGTAAHRGLPVFVAIEDSGPGIPEDMRQHLFEPFVTTKSGGRGLGLSLVARVIEDHGGVVEVTDATVGSGTRFTVYLPAVNSSTDGAQAPSPADTAR
ncbi:MAG: ATP-binding protein [Rhodospirillales bacterium]|nr:ATP-binding protein [Rhodospirillales bacterium]MCY4003381.1 ATP-binding protein [Rhodospirillales bacterium]